MKKSLAIIALAGLAACNGGGSGATGITPGTVPTSAPGTLSTTGVPLVGVGDSLTAGFQSEGFLGDPTATNAVSAYPGNAVPPGQENGFWSLLYQQVTGTPALAMYNAATSPLPLIKAPGIGDQLVLTATGLGALPVTAASTAFNQAGFSSTAFATTRLSTSNTVLDLGVPGITMHEAISMSGPLTGPPTTTSSCTAPSGYPIIPGDPTSGGLQAEVSGESGVFYPVMGGFQSTFTGGSMTELNVATAYKPKLATVWLGANDLLKYIFSNGQSPISDSPTQIGADLTQIVKQLRATGANVLVADLPTVLTTPQFFPQAKFTADFTVLLEIGGVPPAVAPTYAAGITAQLGSAYGLTAGSYLTESGFLGAASQAGTIIAANPAAPDFTKLNLDPCGKGSGAGAAYITPAFATAIGQYNAGINTAIDTVATTAGSGVALVPVNQTFTALAAPGGGVVLGPGETATLQFGGGLVSWDGLHPSNLGYAVIANLFIQAADTPTNAKPLAGLGLAIPPISNATIGTIASQDPYDPFVIKAINPLSPFPLP